MAEVRVPGGLAAPPASMRTGRVRTAEIVEGAVIAILLIATVVFGYEWNAAARSSSNAGTALASRTAVDTYGSTYLTAMEPLGVSLTSLNAAMATGDPATVQSAVTEVQSMAVLLGTRTAGIAVPADVAPAQTQFVDGLSLVGTGADMMQTGLASSDWGVVYEGKAMIDQGWARFDTGRAWIYRAMRAAG